MQRPALYTLILILALAWALGCTVGDYGGKETDVADDAEDDAPDRNIDDDDTADDDDDDQLDCQPDGYEVNDGFPGMFLGQLGSEPVQLSPTLHTAVDHDFFSFYVVDLWNETFSLYIELWQVPAYANYELELYRCDDEQCASTELAATSYNAAGQSESIVIHDTPAYEDGGYYCVRVFSADDYSCDPYVLYLQGPGDK
ncbi:MAG: hypothetical protein P9M14_00015 [Candidatus Alcyoniella australis]|nr:hypothetical protein [Candidatus Alcyoniella australis]